MTPSIGTMLPKRLPTIASIFRENRCSACSFILLVLSSSLETTDSAPKTFPEITCHAVQSRLPVESSVSARQLFAFARQRRPSTSGSNGSITGPLFSIRWTSPLLSSLGRWGHLAAYRVRDVPLRVHRIEQRVAAQRDMGRDNARPCLLPRPSAGSLHDFEVGAARKWASDKTAGGVFHVDLRLGIAVVLGEHFV